MKHTRAKNPSGLPNALSDLSSARNHLVQAALDWLHQVRFNPQDPSDPSPADYALRTAATAYESALNALNEYKSPT